MAPIWQFEFNLALKWSRDRGLVLTRNMFYFIDIGQQLPVLWPGRVGDVMRLQQRMGEAPFGVIELAVYIWASSERTEGEIPMVPLSRSFSHHVSVSRCQSPVVCADYIVTLTFRNEAYEPLIHLRVELGGAIRSLSRMSQLRLPQRVQSTENERLDSIRMCHRVEDP
jgi:hypothetical protein